MSLRPRPEIQKIKACPHGGLNYAELKAAGISPEALIDLSVCTNPFMPPPEIKEMLLGDFAIDKYPDSEASELRQRLADRLKVLPANIIAGSGSTELIRLIALAYFTRGDNVIIFEPTYGEYELASQLAGANVVKHQLRAEDSFAPRIDELVSLIRQHHPRGVFICNPNNPTGKYLSQPEVKLVLEAIGDGLLVLDEAYLSFVEQTWPSIELIHQDNVILLRSMTKDYALTGLRLGYAIASREIINTLRQVCPPWNVNVIAQQTGVRVLEHEEALNESQQKIREARLFLWQGLVELDLPPLPSDTHYFLVRVGNAKVFRARLLRHGIQVRDGTSFGLPEYVRISTRTIPECRKLMAAIKEIKDKGELTAPE
ncbi:MAG: histidinol-phosphate aminotransferase family protein [Dehalococcoidia bacterium]|nr:MAG: histidinol-phosphate aminotransferase family protein [Dehalococcoidia bacterium]